MLLGHSLSLEQGGEHKSHLCSRKGWWPIEGIMSLGSRVGGCLVGKGEHGMVGEGKS